LIEADRFARVTNREVEYFKTKFIVQARGGLKDIQDSLRACDAHDILDNIS